MLNRPAIRGPFPYAPKIENVFLVVDDNIVNRKLLTKILGKYGYAVEGAENGAQALSMYIERHSSGSRYAGIFMDLVMPVMSGAESTKMIRAFEQKNQVPPTPIIAVQVHLGYQLDVAHEAHQNGADAIISKPIRVTEVINIVRTILAPQQAAYRSRFGAKL